MSTKKAYVKQIKGISFVGKTDSNHWITMDGPEESGGSNAGIRPKELLLLGLAGCTGSDVASILKKKRVNTDDFEINITADVSDEHPQVFTKIHIEYVFYGDNIPQKDVERAIELSQTKYCSVTKMLEKAMPITHSYRIEIKKETPAEI
ncbi:MAG: OsmC family protein [Ignavibacteria bacterium]|jgi:putative redox protein|nr:OsmC family protein [Ignavibacteria bacterium]MCU7504336.1 OsmC family protein [Ignavibacteria bacterium]MCU7518181.1 OsmC family protein [Ignavibacteria bacterium]